MFCSTHMLPSPQITPMMFAVGHMTLSSSASRDRQIVPSRPMMVILRQKTWEAWALHRVALDLVSSVAKAPQGGVERPGEAAAKSGVGRCSSRAEALARRGVHQ